MGNGNRVASRGFSDFDSIDEIVSVLEKHIGKRRLNLKFGSEKREVFVEEYNDDGTLVLVLDSECKAHGDFLLYGLSDKYIEVDLRFMEELSPRLLKCKILGARRATQGRSELRFAVQPGSAVATNFRLSKNTIEISKFNIPTGIKVVLDQFQSANSHLADYFKVDVLSSDVKDELLKSIRNTGKNLFIPDCSDISSYGARSDNFLDPSVIYGSGIKDVMRKDIEKGLKSIIIVPVVYLTDDGRSIPFAYIQAVSKTSVFTPDMVVELKEMSFQLVDRIRDANTFSSSVRQDFIDISRGGAKLKITDGELKRYVAKSKGLIFDIVFKLQAPITVYGEVKTVVTDEDGNLVVGVDFGGNSSRQGEMERFYDVLKPMETEYKANLIKSIKAGQGV